MKWIIKLCPCNVDSLHPRLYIAKRGCKEVDFFLILALKHRVTDPGICDNRLINICIIPSLVCFHYYV